MRILHITARADHGGGPENIRRLIAHRIADFEHFVACPCERPYWSLYGELIGVDRLVRLPHRRFNPIALFALARFCRSNDVHLIHSHGFGAGLYGRPLGRFLRLNVIHTFHGFHLHREGSWRGPLKILAERLLRPMTAHYICVSDSECRAAVNALSLSASVVSVVPNGVDTDRFFVQPVAGPEFRILAVGRLSPEKNPFQLLHILQHLRRINPLTTAVLLVAGEGALRPKLEAEIGRLSLGNHVRMLGWIDDIHSLFCMADAYLSTSRGEGLSLGMLEAMSSGLPVVASEVQGHTDVVIPGKTGFLFRENDLDSAARFLDRLESDEQLRKKLANSARSLMLNQFTLSACIQNQEDVARRLVHNPTTSPPFGLRTPTE